jgi:hypothetical protein
MRCAAQLGGAIAVWSAVFAFATQPTPPDNESPIWSTEVMAELSRPRAGITHFPDISRAGIVFLNDGRLIAYEVDHDVGEPSTHTTAEALRPFFLRLSLLDSSTGKVAVRKEERTRAEDAAVFATVDGLMVKTGGRLKLYSPDLVRDHDLPFPLDRNSQFTVSASTTGKTIMLNEVIQDSLNRLHSHFEVLDAMTLKIRDSWDESPPLYHSYSISDDGIAAVDFGNRSIIFSAFGNRRWKKVGDAVGHCSNQNMPTLYAPEQMIYGCDKLIAASTDGHVLMTDSFPSDASSADKTSVAQNGRFIAIALNTIEIKKHFLRESSMRIKATAVVVYDLELRKRTRTLRVDPLPNNDYDFALSPDGSKLAILNDGRVSVYPVLAQSPQ